MLWVNKLLLHLGFMRRAGSIITYLKYLGERLILPWKTNTLMPNESSETL